MLKNLVTLVGSFIICGLLAVLFVMWTDYAYDQGVIQTLQSGCEVNAGQIN